MKGTPKKEAINLDVSAALETANKLTEMTTRQERPANEETKLISIRIKETDYKRLKGLYGSAGLSLSAGMKMSSFYLADMVEQGAFGISAGGFIDRRKN
jgi:hypothetical protein